MNTWITAVLTLIFKVWAVKKCHCWDWNLMSSVKAGLKVIVGLFSACNFFDEALWRCCFYILFFLFLLRQVCVIVPVILLKLKWHHSNYYYNVLFNVFGCNRGICRKPQFHPDISPELEGGKSLRDFNLLLFMS